MISNNEANQFLNRVQVIPLTSKTYEVYPCEAIVKFNGKESKALADQLAKVSKARLLNKAGALSNEDINKICCAVKIQLGMT